MFFIQIWLTLFNFLFYKKINLSGFKIEFRFSELNFGMKNDNYPCIKGSILVSKFLEMLQNPKSLLYNVLKSICLCEIQ